MLSFNKGKIQVNIFIIILTFAIISCTLTFLIAKRYVSGKLVDKYLDNYIESINVDFETNLKEFVLQLNTNCLSITSDKDIYNILLNRELTTVEKQSKLNDIMNPLLDIIAISEQISIITTDNQIYSFSKNNINLAPVNQNFIKSTNSYKMFISDTLRYHNNEAFVVFGKRFINYETSYIIGDLLIYIPEKELHNIYRNITPKSTIPYIMSDNIIISHEDKGLLGSSVYASSEFYPRNLLIKNYNSTKFLYFYDCSYLSEITIAHEIDANFLYTVTSIFNRNIYIFLIISILVSFIVSFYISKKLSFSILHLNNKMKHYTANHSLDLPQNCNTEIKELEESFHKMVIEIDHLMKKNIETEKKQKQAEFAAFQAQINPHFIYNTLDAICWISKKNNQTEIEEITLALSSFFRISLNCGENIVSINDELKHLKSYITIEQIHFPNKFKVYYFISPDIMEIKTIKLILQPLVENCIKHGFDNIDREGIINIYGYKDDENVYFEIEDNGIGVDVDPLKNISSNTGKSYGVFNVNQRLVLEYGSDYGLQYSNTAGGGTTVKIKLKIKDFTKSDIIFPK